MGVRSCLTELNGPDKTFFQIIEQEKNKKVSPRKLELLAPAKNLECGIAAHQSLVPVLLRVIRSMISSSSASMPISLEPRFMSR